MAQPTQVGSFGLLCNRDLGRNRQRMSLASNPFYVLGAAPSDDRRRIMALANNRRLDGDEAAIREARIVLTTPRKRLAAEIAWLPGLEEDEIRRALAAENEHPGAALRMTDLPALARANLMADGLVEADPQTVFSSDLAAWIVELAATHARIRADKVTTAVNEARLAAGVPMASQQDVVEELRGLGNHFRDAMERCLDSLAFGRMVEVVTLVGSSPDAVERIGWGAKRRRLEQGGAGWTDRSGWRACWTWGRTGV